jgi:TrmH family RNA methyltransferase
MSLLQQLAVVLYEPQDQVNIGATARAMRNMGVSDLRLVRPVVYQPERIETIAHGTAELIGSAKHASELEAAIADCVDVVAFTARHRSAKRTVVAPREMSERVTAGLTQGRVALLFGREDSGLPNAALDRANILCTIPTTENSSLNLAQAVVVALYEVHVAAGDATRTLPPPKHDMPPATAQQFEQLFIDAERALDRIEFFKTRYREHVMRTVRSLAYRAAPDGREIKLLRAIAIEVLRAWDRATIIPPSV